MPSRFRSPFPRLFARSGPSRLVAALLLSLGAAAAAGAEVGGEPAPPMVRSSALRWSGFATLGGVYSDADAPWQFRRDVLQRATGHPGRVQGTVDSRIGLQANWQIADNWEAVVQGVLKPIAQDAPVEQRIEWAFVSYRPAPGWEGRFGRVSTDNYLESQYSNVGFAYPWVRPNMEFYGWTSLSAVDGVDLTRDWDAAGTRWRWRLGLGQAELAVPAPPGQRIDFLGRDMLSTSLTAETGGWLFKASFIRMNVSFDSDQDLGPLVTGLGNIERLPAIAAPAAVREQARALRAALPYGALASRYAAVGAQYRSGPWLTQAELSHSLTGDLSEVARLTTSVAYRSGAWTWFGTAGRTAPREEAPATPQWQAALTPALGAVTAAQAQFLGATAAAVANVARIEQRSIGAGVRWDYADRSALKLQLDRFKVAPNGSALWANGTPEQRRIHVLSVVVDTVF